MGPTSILQTFSESSYIRESPYSDIAYVASAAAASVAATSFAAAAVITTASTTSITCFILLLPFVLHV